MRWTRWSDYGLRDSRCLHRTRTANLNIHLHCLVLDGVYRCDGDGAPGFVEAGAPTDEELHAPLHTVIARLMKMLTRRPPLTASPLGPAPGRRC